MTCPLLLHALSRRDTLPRRHTGVASASRGFSRFLLASALVVLAGTTLPVCAQPAAAGNSAAPLPAESSGPVANVNGRDIPRLRSDLLVRQRPSNAGPDSPQLRSMIRDELISRELVVQEAEQKGLLQRPEVVEQIELARQQVILGAYMQDFVKANPITEDQVRVEYERMRKEVSGNEYKSAHILVKTEADAKDLVAKIRKGAKFADLARLASEDPGSKDSGGDLGWNVPTTFVKPFADAMVKLKKGEISEPVQTQFGYHVIRLDDQRPVKAPPLEQLKPQIEQRLQQAKVQKLIADLRAKAKIQ